jgi:prephenate dehydratase
VSFSGPKARVAFQGEHGAFSEEAAIKLLGPAIELVPRRTFAELFSSIDEGVADFVLAPVENTLAGPVKAAIEKMREGALTITEEITIRVEQQLIGCPGAVFDEIVAVESHPVALAQCRSFFADNPQILMIESDDTAGSVARIVAAGDRKRAAIASRRAAEIYRGVILRGNVEDDRENYTRFLLLSRAKSNSLECGGPAPLWPAAAWRRFLEEHASNGGRDTAATGQSADKAAHSKERQSPTNLY